MTVLLVSIMSLFTATGQVLVKKGINRKKPYYLDPYIAAGGLLILFAPLLYMKALTYAGLSDVYGLNGIAYILVYLLGVVVLGERGSFLQTLGILFIAGGVFLWSI